MKIRTILCFFFVSYFAHAVVVSNPIIPTLSDLIVCDNDSDGIAIFDLSTQSPIILAAQSTPASQVHIKGNEIIDNNSVYNLLGQLVYDQKALSSDLHVDFSELKLGNYYVKVSSGTKNSTFKIVKE